MAVFDVPKCGLPKPLNGLHLTDWLVHGRYFKTPQSHPEGLATEVVAQFGPAPPSRCGYEVGPLSDAEVAEVVGNLQTSVTRKRAAARHYLEADAWDLFVVGFKEAHCAGHHLWDLVDPGHPEHSSARSARLGDPLRKIYQDLDAAVGELIAAADGADVAVFSTTDMEPNATLSHLMPEVVRRINQVLDDRPLTRALRRIQRASARWPSGWPCELLPYNENCTALRVYTPDSRLRPGTRDGVARETTLDHVESLLRKLTDVDTGDPVVASIERPSAELSGERSAALPDLLVRYEPGTFPRAVVSPRLGRVEAERPPLRPGDHAAGGFLIASGRFGAGVSGMEDLGVMAASVLGVPVAQTPGRAGGPDPEASSIANAAEAVSRGSRPRRTAASPR